MIISNINYSIKFTSIIRFPKPKITRRKFGTDQKCQHRISEYYKESNILITGGTGFLGKVLLEKLLRSCPVNSIYLLIRPMRSVSAEERLQEIFKAQVFDLIKNSAPKLLDKVKVIQGDILEENLGLTGFDQQVLEEKINLVFHSAATVRFNEPLKYAVQMNTLGTKRILDISCRMRNLKNFVHISTAYSNCPRLHVEERVYETKYDPYAIIDFVDKFPEKDVKILTKRILGSAPNTYKLTKCLAERIVQDYSEKLPATIVRPSMVTASWQEPMPGWIDNLYGANSFCSDMGRGQLRFYPSKSHVKFDIIPVDVVAKICLTSPWHSSTYNSNNFSVYACSTGELNKLTWGDFVTHALETSRKYPTKNLTWYPRHPLNNNQFTVQLYQTLINKPVALLLDLCLRLKGEKCRYMKTLRRYESLHRMLPTITTVDTTFSAERLKDLMLAVKECEDAEDFDFDFRAENGFKWDEYFKGFVVGLRKNVFFEDVEDGRKNRVKLHRYYWLDIGIKTCPAILLATVYLIYF